MGGKKRTIQNSLLLRVDNALNLLYVKGGVPGSEGTFVKVSDALKKQIGRNSGNGVTALPYPAATDAMAREYKLENAELVLDFMKKGDSNKAFTK